MLLPVILSLWSSVHSLVFAYTAMPRVVQVCLISGVFEHLATVIIDIFISVQDLTGESSGTFSYLEFAPPESGMLVLYHYCTVRMCHALCTVECYLHCMTLYDCCILL